MVLSMERWVGKVAIVTGASSGIGASIAEQLVANGVIVVGMARRSELIEAKSQELADKPGKLYAYKIDLFNETEILEAFKWVEDNIGPVSILVNNAGTSQNTTLYDGDTEAWRSVFELNVITLCVCTREAIRIMQKNDINGHIIHINSLFGHKVPNFSMNVYAPTKYAVTALTETLRIELNSINSKIKISSISPGLVESEMTSLNPNPDICGFFEGFPILKSEDIADSVIYALSTPEEVQVYDLIIKPMGEVN